METDKDHINYMIETEPTMSISKIVSLMKSYTTYHIWKRYSNYLRKHFWKEHTFWTDGYFACSIGNVSEEMPHKNKNIGLDLGIKDFCVTSDGEKYKNPKTIKRYEKKLTKLQRQLAHKEKRSKNYYKARKQIALCHEKIRNARKDYLHKTSHKIISENQVIVSENLQIKNMVKNHHLAKSIADVSWYEFTR